MLRASVAWDQHTRVASRNCPDPLRPFLVLTRWTVHLPPIPTNVYGLFVHDVLTLAILEYRLRHNYPSSLHCSPRMGKEGIDQVSDTDATGCARRSPLHLRWKASHYIKFSKERHAWHRDSRPYNRVEWSTEDGLCTTVSHGGKRQDPSDWDRISHIRTWRLVRATLW